MRKFTLLLTFLAFSIITFAQNDCGLYKLDVAEEGIQLPVKKATGDVFWMEDFAKDDWISTVDQGDQGGYLYNGTAMPENWEVVDVLESGYYWHWSDVGPRGRYTSFDSEVGLSSSLVPDNDYITEFNWPAGTTLDNGFMTLELDFYNTTSLGEMVAAPIDMDSYLNYGPIDCSDKANVVVSMNVLYRFCCVGGGSTFDIQVSNDYDPADPTSAHWTSYKINKLTPNNSYTYAEERYVELNISDVAANSGEVYFRFHTAGASHYMIMLDDIKFMEGPAKDVIVTDGWAEYLYLVENGDAFYGGFTQIPVDIVSEFTMFRAAALNNGSEEATGTKLVAKITKGEEEVYSAESAPANIAAFTSDTLKIASNFSPADLGIYQISMTVQLEGDEFPGNNSWGYDFEVSENRYSHVRHGMEEAFGSAGPRDWADGGSEGDMVAIEYNLAEGSSAIFSGIEVYIHPTSRAPELAAIEAGQFQMKARAFKYDEEVDDYVDLNLTSQLYTLSLADTGKWVYLQYIDEGELFQQGGDYLVGIETYTGTNQELRFEIGDDGNGVKQYNSSLWYSNLNAGWYLGTGNNYAIDLMVNLPEQAKFTINYDMSEAISAGTFNPDNDVIYVTGSFADWNEPGSGKSVLATYDAATMTATATAMVDKNTDIEYKGFVNTGWDNGEWTGDPNRAVSIVDADVTVNHVFGVKPGNSVDSESLNIVKLYPNPFNSTLTIDNLNNVTSITLSNIVGQTVMNITNVESTVELSTSELESGVYVITITDANNNVRTERVVKH